MSIENRAIESNITILNHKNLFTHILYHAINCYDNIDETAVEVLVVDPG